MKKKIKNQILAQVMIVLLLLVTIQWNIPPNQVQAATSVTLTSQQVKEYFEAQVGNTVPVASCLAFIANSFQSMGATRDSANCAYEYGLSHIMSNSRDNIPIGADVFFKWNSNYTGTWYTCGDHYCHHIAVYVGDGYVVHTSGGKVIKTKIDTVLSWGCDFWGWGYHGNVSIVEGNVDVITAQNIKYPINKQTGKTFSVSGLVVSPNNIVDISIGVKDLSGNVKFSATATPYSKNYNISDVDSQMAFKSLAAGTYIYYLSAKDAIGATVNWERQFMVSGSATTSSVETTKGIKHSHNYTSVVTKEPTCIAKGVRTYTCNGAGTCDRKIYTEEIAMIAHNYASYYTVDEEATTTKEGSKSRHCLTPGCTAKTDITTIPQKTMFTYNVLDSQAKTCEITGYTGDDTELVIPTVLDEYKVVSINSYAFSGRSDLRAITIPEGVTNIGEYAFRGCGITSVEIPNGVTSLGAWAFENCSSLKEVKISAGVPKIGFCAFRYCDNLKKVTISDGVLEIGAGAFVGCSSLTEISIPESVENIGSLAFSSCSGITKVNNKSSIAVNLKSIRDDVVWYDISTGREINTIANGTAKTTVSSVKPEAENGLVLDGDGFKYYENGTWISDKYAFVEYDGARFLVANGTMATNINGLANDPEHKSDWYYVAAGKIQEQTQGLVEYDNEWFYVQNGKMDTAHNGYVMYDGGKFLVAVGRIVREASGLVQDPNNADDWYYLAEGQKVEYTGLALYDGEWFYVIDGRLAVEYTGDVQYNGATFFVVNGMYRAAGK